ncbi:hypothetical protein PC116_g7717 [Phytophthora cactorum]|nr:hypothetical protein PC119_g4145 [Phytophthora cactorum]KAG3186967.1 hypothetical protein C6341_g3567 [Phytophthora cactorum]KAG3199293.1 hypothetical protein PC128_g5393 [Phytophthora cactorum]KAG4244462.1 hypothetical protein PC116_g7717 [Phytophthora cactorum]
MFDLPLKLERELIGAAKDVSSHVDMRQSSSGLEKNAWKEARLRGSSRFKRAKAVMKRPATIRLQGYIV